MNCLVGKYITEKIYNHLESEQQQDHVENILASAFSLNGLDFKRRHIALTFFMRNYGFCKQHAFNYRKTSSFLSILHVLLERDTRLHSDEIDMTRSCDYFEELLQAHSVERSPYSTKVFDEQDVPRIYDFVLTQYYQNFKLFRYIFGVHSRIFLQQRSRNDVDEPNTSKILPLPIS